jgi:primosomal protein N' (replication factor Y)
VTRLISVAVPIPFLDLLTYNVPPHLELPPVGARVRVPIGSRTVTGCVVEHDVASNLASAPGDEEPEAASPGDVPPRPASPGAGRRVKAREQRAVPAAGSVPTGEAVRPAEIKDVVEVIDLEPFLPSAVVGLCRWVADYYLSGIGDAIAVAMPPGAQARASGYKTRRAASITVHGLSAVAAAAGPDPAAGSEPGAGSGSRPGTASERTEDIPGPRLTAKQRAALEILAAAPAGLPASELRDRGVTSDQLARLAARGFVTLRDEQDERDPFARSVLTTVPFDSARQLTAEQTEALAQLGALADAGEFKVALLHGVTGSGKTEIYLRLADRVARGGRQVLLMVPEIALTPSVAALFRGAFGDRVAIQHSALSDGERHDQWQRIRRGDIDIVVGTRSAVFAPLPRLGAIIVDEEHDASYKQEETPRYHGRDVAIVRASREQALVVLGSATPSMETFQNAATGKYASASLERRVLDRPLASVRLVNMRDEYAEDGPDVVISRELFAAIEDRLTRREQVMVLLNRRGYSTAVFCRQCGDAFDCPNCSLSLTVHRAGSGWNARCHYCNYSTRVPKTCRKCAAPYLEHTGFGTEKVEQHLRDRFPEARIGRVDRDSVRRKGALTSLLGRFSAGELDLLVGTQMIAKGHDFPRVTLVGVISADVGLGLADFRAGERTFQLLTQVAGRAGRGERLGEAIVQTLYPEHYSIQLACHQDYAAFFARELAFRRGMRYPPMVAMVNTVVRGKTFDEAMQIATDIIARLEPAATIAGFSILGPAPAPLARLRGEHRVQFFLKGTRRADMRNALKNALSEMPDVRRRTTVDIDPLSVL